MSCTLLTLLHLALASAQDAPPRPQVDREAMWWAPTAEDWARPVLIQWQRTWEDAVAVSKETGRPILVCVNMDGEIASEHYAGIRYRQPEIAALYEPYVCVIASTYRHVPRDHDEEGRRIECPRFGTVTCGEHIAIEPGLYEKFFDGERVAPRHVAVELDGSESYDVYYAWDTDSVFAAIREGVAGRDLGPPEVRGDRPIVERVASRHVVDREAVEAAYREGDDAQRRALLAAAAEHADAAPTGLLRLAVNGFDADLAALARRALAKVESPDAVGLIGDALRVAISQQERDALVAALDRMGAQAPKARMLAAAQRGISGRSETLDAQAWIAAIESDPGAPPPEELAARLARQAKILAEGSAAELADLAEAFLLRARDGESDPGFARLLVLDAQETARRARAAGAYGWRVDALLANAAYLLGDREAARGHAVAAIAEVPARAAGEDAMVVLALLAEARWDAISKASLRKEPWPPEWFTDVHAAYSVLAHHPLGTDGQVAGHHDVLEWLGARGEAARVLARGLARHPDSAALHERLRGQILREQGVGGLESTYESMLRETGPSAHLGWFAGYASVVTAEFHRRAGDEGAALAAYQRAQARYERCVELDPETGESSAAWLAMIRAGRARLALERGDLHESVEELLAALVTAPGAAATDDGLGISAVATARTLRARLGEAGLAEQVARVDAALAALDPQLLALPASERRVRRPDAGGGN